MTLKLRNDPRSRSSRGFLSRWFDGDKIAGKAKRVRAQQSLDTLSIIRTQDKSCVVMLRDSHEDLRVGIG